MDYDAYRDAYFADPPPEARFAFVGAFGATLYFEAFAQAVAFYTEVLGPPSYVEGEDTRGWPIGRGWLTLLQGRDGNPKNVELTIELGTIDEAERLQAAFVAAGGRGSPPADRLMYRPVRTCPVVDPFGTELMIVAALPVTNRVDAASRSIAASPDAVYRAFAEPGAMERWLPPNDMTGTMLRFDFREGGSYRMRLTYAERDRGQGKTREDADETTVRLTRLVPGRSIEQTVVFDSEDAAFAGTMRMTWTMEAQGARTLVTVRAEDVPVGIRAEDHVAALTASLEQLARFVEG